MEFCTFFRISSSLLLWNHRTRTSWAFITLLLSNHTIESRQVSSYQKHNENATKSAPATETHYSWRWHHTFILFSQFQRRLQKHKPCHFTIKNEQWTNAWYFIIIEDVRNGRKKYHLKMILLNLSSVFRLRKVSK